MDILISKWKDVGIYERARYLARKNGYLVDTFNMIHRTFEIVFLDNCQLNTSAHKFHNLLPSRQKKVAFPIQNPLQPNLQNKSKPRPIVPPVPLFFFSLFSIPPPPLFIFPIPIISPSSLSDHIFSLQSEEENHTHSSTHDQHSQRDPISHGIFRRLFCYEDIGCDNAANIPHSYLKSGGNGTFVVACHILF